jgi:peptidoglycan/xylan/chitin deacetylase (PgdA/CDA1 family)
MHLTFDDGPHPTITPKVLQLLDEFNQKATFFLIGDNVRKYPEVVEQILDAGHSIGNHTYDHRPAQKVSLNHYLRSIEQCDALIPETPLFRPPHGRIGRRQIKRLANRQIIMWTLLSGDFDPNLVRTKALRQLKKHTTTGTIVVFHDSEKAEANLMALLPEYLNHLRQHQFQSIGL